MTRQLLVALGIGLGVMATLMFFPAGRVGWWRGWLYLLVAAVHLIALFGYVKRVNPGLIEQRQRVRAGTKRWDRVLLAVLTPVFLSTYVIAGFDAIRCEWTTMSAWWWPLGLALLMPGTVLYAWSMGVNPFFEKTVRIQKERDHRVIDSGPYAFVRHPGYAGFMGWLLSAPLLLGSWWACVPAIMSIVGLVLRTALEDRTLRDALSGYETYATRVRYR